MRKTRRKPKPTWTPRPARIRPASPAAPTYDDRRNEPVYHAFTTNFDEVVDAVDLCDADELTRLRQLLDQQLSHLQAVVAKLANRLQRRLMAQQSRAWEFDLEEGLLDSARLARAPPTDDATLLQAREGAEFRDTVVSLLIDNLAPCAAGRSPWPP
jgi:cobaltochelatase CobT